MKNYETGENVRNSFAKGFIISIQIEKSNELYKVKVILKKKEREDFINLLSELYKKEIKVRERDEFGSKMFLLKGTYSFNQIQEIKRKYGFSW